MLVCLLLTKFFGWGGDRGTPPLAMPAFPPSNRSLSIKKRKTTLKRHTHTHLGNRDMLLDGLGVGHGHRDAARDPPSTSHHGVLHVVHALPSCTPPPAPRSNQRCFFIVTQHEPQKKKSGSQEGANGARRTERTGTAANTRVVNNKVRVVLAVFIGGQARLLVGASQNPRKRFNRST